jgi:protein SMG6
MRALIKQSKEKATTRRYAAVVAPSLKTAPVWNPTRKLQVQPGYTILVVDLNILLNALPLFVHLLDSGRWDVVVPLAVLLELDGLKNGLGQLGATATKAVAFIEDSSQEQLKVQTNRGNYLSDLSIRFEELDYSTPAAGSLDDHVLRVALFQQDCFSSPATAPRDTSQVAVVSFNRALRQRARSRGIEAINEVEILRCILPKLPDG